ncbi:MAG: cation-translocating P-type ATPase [Caldilineaceae bacterium]
MVASALANQPITCALCGLSTHYPLQDETGQNFCCPACREVSIILAREAKDSVQATVSAPIQELTTTTLCLGGLWCTSCGWLVGATLQRSAGVQAAEVNFLQREARITYDPARTDAFRLAKQVARLGYRAWPAAAEADQPEAEEEREWLRLLIAGVLVMQVMMMSFSIYLRDWLGWSSPETQWLVDILNVVNLVLTLPVLLILGVPVVRAGAASLLRGRPNLHTFVALGASAAFALSVRNLVAGHERVYFDTAVVLFFLVAVGRWFEMQAQKQSSQVVERLAEQLPRAATWLSPTGEQQIPLDQVTKGARLRVRPGERFPVDGLIAAGEGDVDESLLTGEPDPVLRRAGDRVLAGAINLDGSFEVITTAVGAEAMAGQIGRLLHQALWQRAPIERLADKLAAWMTPVVLLLASMTFALWSWQNGLETGLVYALSVMLIACPCGLGIATPLTLWIGLGRAAEAGVLLRSTGVLEQLATVRHAFFDKTGTLTQRPLRVQDIVVEGNEALLLAHVHALESASEHPLAQAIVAGIEAQASQRSIVIERPAMVKFRALPGRGVMGEVAGVALWVGSRSLMAEAGLALSPALALAAVARQRLGLTVVYAGWAGAVQGILALGEKARPEAGVTLMQLQAAGVQVTVLTGDDRIAGARWQRDLAVPVLVEQRPEDKLHHLQRAGAGVLMVGDGINDGPALAAATVSIALHQGTDVAQAAADAILLHDDLSAIPWLLQLARLAMHKVRQNLAWAFTYNLVGVGLAMTGHLQPSIAALLMVASSLFVTSNALRLRRFPATERMQGNEHCHET